MDNRVAAPMERSLLIWTPMPDADPCDATPVPTNTSGQRLGPRPVSGPRAMAGYLALDRAGDLGKAVILRPEFAVGALLTFGWAS